MSWSVAGAFALEPVVIGQSLPLGGADDGSSARTIDGAQAYVEFVNSTGGVRGRPVRLVTLDDGGDPKRHAENVRQLVAQHKAVAVLNCLGDASCLAAGEVARQQKIALVGPVSGAQALGRAANPYVFRIRASYAREAEALARQLQALGATSAALITDKRPTSESVAALTTALAKRQIGSTLLTVDPANPAALDTVGTEVSSAKYQAVFLDIGTASFVQLTRPDAHTSDRWPLVITTFASGNVNSLLSGFANRMVGFTTVVPNPELSAIPLARDIQVQAERYSSGQALTFAGMEAYINTRVCIEAIRRADAARALDARGVLGAMNSLGFLDLGGFDLNFSGASASASERVDIVVRSRTGHLLK